MTRAARRRLINSIINKPGQPVGLSTCKRVEPVATTTTTTPSVLSWINCTNIAQGQSINERERDLINCRGLKVRFFGAIDADRPCEMHIAVVSPKGETGAIGNTDWFRSVQTTRGINLDPALLSGLEMNTLPINADKWMVLKHWKVKTAATTSAGGYNTGVRQNWFTKEAYVPIKRQLRFTNNQSTSCRDPIYLVWWWDCSQRDRNELWPAFDADASALVRVYPILYYKDPK